VHPGVHYFCFHTCVCHCFLFWQSPQHADMSGRTEAKQEVAAEKSCLLIASLRPLLARSAARTPLPTLPHAGPSSASWRCRSALQLSWTPRVCCTSEGPGGGEREWGGWSTPGQYVMSRPTQTREQVGWACRIFGNCKDALTHHTIFIVCWPANHLSIRCPHQAAASIERHRTARSPGLSTQPCTQCSQLAHACMNGLTEWHAAT
jgi:hypothetical protein